MPLACIIEGDRIEDWFSIVLFLVILAGSIVARYWRFLVQRLRGVQARDWAAVSATIDVVSVVVQVEEGRSGERIVGYLATLTYFYRNPELEMGEYSRMFGYEHEADAWAQSYKGQTVLVHVDPRDPSKSVLREEDLGMLPTPRSF